MASVKLTEVQLTDSTDDVKLIGEKNNELVRVPDAMKKLNRKQNAPLVSRNILNPANKTKYFVTTNSTSISTASGGTPISYFVQVKRNTNYAIRKHSNSSRFVIAAVSKVDVGAKVISLYPPTGTNGTEAVVNSGDYDYLLIQVTTAADAVFPDMQVEEGDVFTEYEPYSDVVEGAVYAIATGGKPVRIDDKLDGLDHENAVRDRHFKAVESRVSNLEAVANGYLYMPQTDNETACQKDVPARAMPWSSVDKVGCKTLVWNQLQPNTISRVYGGVNFDFDNGTLTISATGEERSAKSYWLSNNVAEKIKFTANHRYFICGVDDLPNEKSAYIPNDGVSPTIHVGGKGKIVTMDADREVFFQIMIADTDDLSTPIVCKPQIFDLTAMFGAGNEPTIEQFHEMFPADCYTYSEPTLMSFAVNEMVSKGRNLLSGMETGMIGTSTGNESANTDYCRSGFIPVDFTKHNQYYVIGMTDASNFITAYNHKKERIARTGSNTVSTRVLTTDTFKNSSAEGITDTEPKYIRIAYYKPLSESVKIAVYADEEREYIPYHEQTYTFANLIQKYFPDGMKSAGNVCDEVDLERGVAVQRVGSVNMGTLAWDVQDLDGCIFRATVNGKILEINNKNIICSRYSTAQKNGTETIIDKTIAASNTSTRVYVKDTGYDNVEGFQNSLSGVMLHYELAAPIETPIDPADIHGLSYINVEAGGVLAVQHSDDCRVPMPNQETFMIDLRGEQA